jgi:hypothetical protein
MIDSAIKDQLLKQVDQLTLEGQHQVLEFVNSLAKRSSSKIGPKNFLELCGILDSQSAEEMRQAIEEGCERIDPNDW